MRLRCFSYTKDNILDAELCQEIVYTVNNLKYYFVKFNKARYKEAMHRTIQHALEHYDEFSGSLVPYVKSLARTILKDYNKKVTPVEDTEPYNSVHTPDFADEIIELMQDNSIDEESVSELALTYMSYFLNMCVSILKEDISPMYFPKEFKLACLKLSRNNPVQFNQIALEIYREHATSMREFIDMQESFDKTWVEADYSLIQKETSKRVKLYSTTKNLDRGTLKIKGKYSNKKLVRVYYRDILEYLCDLVDEEENNILRYNIGDSYIIRTLGGSISVVNVPLFNMYDLIRDEILTNIITCIKGKYLGAGSEYFYFLTGADVKTEPKRFGNISITFECEEVII